MNPFHQALDQGYEADDILKYLSTAIPQFSPLIKKASRTGYNAKQILGFLSANFDTEDRRGMSESERHAANRRADAERTKYGLKMVASAVAAPIVAGAARGALSRALPNSLKNMLNPQPSGGVPAPSGVPQSPQTISPSSLNVTNPLQSASAPTSQMPQAQNITQPSSSQPPAQNVQPNITQAPASVQPEVKSILSKHGLLKHVDEMSKNQKDPKAIAGILYAKYPQEMKAFQADAGKNMEDAIGDYLASKPQEKVKDVAAEVIEPKPMAKNETVATPHGIGEIKSDIRNGKAIVEVNGKKHQVNADELIQSPLPEKDLSDLYDDLIQGIEKHTGKQVSRNVEWAGYDPRTNELAYKPHGSDRLYAYDEISPEDIEILTSFLTQRKSTGENFIGAWEKGSESPIGAAMYQLIQRLQKERGGKGNEYKNRYETIYDAIEPAKKASKEKHAERKKKAKKPRLT